MNTGSKRVSIEALDEIARAKWETILQYMVGSTGTALGVGSEITTGTKTLLEVGQFIEMRGGRPSITQGGFSFLLQEVNAQVWSLLIVYLENSHRVRIDPSPNLWKAVN